MNREFTETINWTQVKSSEWDERRETGYVRVVVSTLLGEYYKLRGRGNVNGK